MKLSLYPCIQVQRAVFMSLGLMLSSTLFAEPPAPPLTRIQGIRCRFDVPDPLPELTLTSAVRHHLFLAAKEALQNIVKHSGASEAWLRVHMEGEDLVVSLEDNVMGGAVLPAAACPSAKNGNGLANIKYRMESIGGRFELESKPGEGTFVRLVLSQAGRYHDDHKP